MSTDKPLVNRVKKSPLINLNLETYYPEVSIVEFDLKDFLFKGLILREKEFRSALKDLNWSAYEGCALCVYCSTDAIIPLWAYMLIASEAAPYARECFYGTKEQFLQAYFKRQIAEEDWSKYENSLIVIKGCSDKEVPPSAYFDLTLALRPYAKSIMFGEACSTVPVYKKKKS